MLHRRPDKDSHLDTILYEIDMLHHCSKTLALKKAKRYESQEAAADYNLGILIHLRNLLAFLTTLHSRNTDLRLDRPEVWLGRALAEKEYYDLRDKAQTFSDTYSETLSNGQKLDCHELISKFLQHCTPERYEQSVVGWDIEKMTAEIEPILAEFEKRFPAGNTGVKTMAGMTGVIASTATLRKDVVWIIPAEEE